MTRTMNTLRVTFSANIDAGEGYLTEKAHDDLTSVCDQGWLWAKDVLEDWSGEIDRMEGHATAGFLGWFDAESPNASPCENAKDLAFRLWDGGVWPDIFVALNYEEEASDSVFFWDWIYKVDDVAASNSFKYKIHEYAKKEANKFISDLKWSGVKYSHGNHPKKSDLVMFYVLCQLIDCPRSDDPIAEVVREMADA